uniref:Uncharacterized protein n=1 Tax=Arundo donax TaxID=35708 RepID=A0A0A9EFD3_ARUDO
MHCKFHLSFTNFSSTNSYKITRCLTFLSMICLLIIFIWCTQYPFYRMWDLAVPITIMYL